MNQQRYLRPVDVLHFRGNKLFGGAGMHGEGMMPPWPSVPAGALRSRMLVDAGISPASFAQGNIALLAPLDAILGTPATPGSFRVNGFGVAKSPGEPLFRLPSDCVVQKAPDSDTVTLSRMQPRALPELMSSAGTPELPVLRTPAQSKAESGRLLTLAGWQAWLAGKTPDADRHTVKASDIWGREQRLGIALDATTRSAEDGRIYTTDAISMKGEAGFWVEISGADSSVPAEGLVRLGGDGRAAQLGATTWAMPASQLPAQGGSFCLVLTSPGLFPNGWRLPGMDETGLWQGPAKAFSARLACATVSRAEVVSGWDLALQAPKTAQRAAPAGSVYWFRDFTGDLDALQKLLLEGLWGFDSQTVNLARRAEGFNAFSIGAWAG